MTPGNLSNLRRNIISVLSEKIALLQAEVTELFLLKLSVVDMSEIDWKLCMICLKASELRCPSLNPTPAYNP